MPITLKTIEEIRKYMGYAKEERERFGHAGECGQMSRNMLENNAEDLLIAAEAWLRLGAMR